MWYIVRVYFKAQHRAELAGVAEGVGVRDSTTGTLSVTD